MRYERGYVRVNGKWVPKDKTIIEWAYTKMKLKNRERDFVEEPSARSKWIDSIIKPPETAIARKK